MGPENFSNNIFSENNFNALPLAQLEPFLRQMQQLDELAKSLEPLDIVPHGLNS